MTVEAGDGLGRCSSCGVVLDGRAYEYGAPDGSVVTWCLRCALWRIPDVVAALDGIRHACPECEAAEAREDRLRRAESTIRHRRGRRLH